MVRDFEEVLEAVWMCDEKKINSLDEVRKVCHIKIEADLLETMQKEELIAYDEKNIYFTGSGKDIAKGLIRRKRLAEELLVHVLNIKGDRASKIVCEFEHSVIPEVEESICILLGHPKECPHGLTIPAGKCCESGKNNIEKRVDSITNFDVSDKVKISYIRPSSHQRLHKLMSFGLNPGTMLEIHQITPTFIIKYDNTEIAMDKDIAENIYGWRSN